MTQPPPQMPPPPSPDEPYDTPPPGSEGKRSNGMAVAALVCGILALLFGILFFPLGILLGVVAIVLGIVGIRRARQPRVGGQGMAVGGLVTGALGLLIGVLLLVTIVSVFNNPAVQDAMDRLQRGEDPQEVLEDLQEELAPQPAP